MLAASFGIFVWTSDVGFEKQSLIFRPARFSQAGDALPAVRAGELAFSTTNLDQVQYRIASQRAEAGSQTFEIHAAVPTDPFDRALDNFRAIQKGTLPLLVILASLLG